MSAFISGIVFAFGAQAFAYAMLRMAKIPAERALLIWGVGAVLLFGLRDPLSVLLLLGGLAIVTAPIPAAPRAAFYLAIVPCLPTYLATELPFPGINFLAIISFERIANVGLLLPILFYARPDAPVRFQWVDLALVAYAAYISTMLGNLVNLTSGLRFFADNLILLALPYAALSRAITTREDLDTCFKGFLIAATVLAAVALIASGKQWDFYRLLEPASILTVPDYRGGWLRIAISTSTVSLGYCFVVGLVLLEYLKTKLGLGFLLLNLWRALFLFGVFVTGSRGALGALVLAGGIYTVFSIRSRFVKSLLGVGFAVGTVLVGIWLYTADHSKVDPYGTFDYRQELLKTSLEYIQEHLFFGDLDFLNSGEFDHLVQGQGIIDITNFYLQVGLNFGLLGLVLFFSVMAWTIVVLVFAAVRETPGDNPCAAMLAAVSGWLLLVATTSDVALTLYFGLVVAALGRAAYALTKPARVRVIKPPLSEAAKSIRDAFVNARAQRRTS